MPSTYCTVSGFLDEDIARILLTGSNCGGSARFLPTVSDGAGYPFHDTTSFGMLGIYVHVDMGWDQSAVRKRHQVTNDKSEQSHKATPLGLTRWSQDRTSSMLTVFRAALRTLPQKLQQDPLCELVAASFAKLRAWLQAGCLSADIHTRLTVFLEKQDRY